MKLEPPVRKYLVGRRPSHSSTQKLHENFRQFPKEAMESVLSHGGYMADGKPTKRALNDGLLDVCQKSILWNLDEVQKELSRNGFPVERQSVNQEIEPSPDGKPQWVNLGTIGTYFDASSAKVGKWLDELGLRDEETKLATQDAMDRGLAQMSEMKSGPGKQTRTISVWDRYGVCVLLRDSGHELDFDYEKSLKGNAKNSDVTVSSIDTRAKEFAREFISVYNDPKRRRETDAMVKRTPTAILKKAETMMKRPGFLTTGQFRKHF